MLFPSSAWSRNTPLCRFLVATQRKKTSTAEDERALVSYEVRKGRSGSTDDNDRNGGSKIILLTFLLLFAAIVEAKMRLDEEEPDTLADLYDLMSGQSESTAICLKKLEDERDRAVDNVLHRDAKDSQQLCC